MPVNIVKHPMTVTAEAMLTKSCVTRNTTEAKKA
jgi:hypothetical protein